ncbi:alpha/beta hydrolase [Dietzia massiliensis]|uniref:alpha/beta hydrolase n=1 Tax=Dietzia massiliensis TaxID=2697499 RepID=UPI001BCEA431|nr:alpha/beta hydrolase family protein [Dietzia massiliensis]MBS7549343.1 esterase family protein [Dietzia massiliensis]MBS7549348.1 esterase family protein [Dietzia massiliensis]
MRRLRRSHALPLLVPALAAALVGGAVAPAAAQSLPAGSTPDIGSVMGSLGGSVDPSSAAAGSATVGSTGSTGTDSLVGSGTLPPLGTGSQNTSATPPIGMESEPVTVSEVRRVETGDPLVAGGDPRFERWWVASESMNRVLPVEIWRPASDAPAPMLYLLDGVDSPSPSGWLLPGGVDRIFAGEHVTLVMPTRAGGSLHADWQRDDPVLSRNKWQTFLTEELPPLLEAGDIPFNGKRGMAGLSMGAASAVTIAERRPDLYEAVGAIAGCYTARDDLGFILAKIVAETRGGDIANMWGPRTDPDYLENDGLLNADELAGKALYFATATGMPDATEWDRNGRDLQRFTQGAGLEMATHACTVEMDRRLDELGIDARVDYLPTGLHNWDNFGRFVAPMRDTLMPALR